MALMGSIISRNVNWKEANPVGVDVSYQGAGSASAIGRGVDQLRGSIFELPLLWFLVSYLWHRGVVTADPNKSFGISDAALALIIAWLLKYIGVTRVWR